MITAALIAALTFCRESGPGFYPSKGQGANRSDRRCTMPNRRTSISKLIGDGYPRDERREASEHASWDVDRPLDINAG